MNDKPIPNDKNIAGYRADIQLIHDKCTEALAQAISDDHIHKQEKDAAEQALLELRVGVQGLQERSEELRETNPDLANFIETSLACVMRGLFVCGGLVVTSHTSADASKKRHAKSQPKKAHETLAARKDWHLEAIRFALSQPPSRPLQKRRGPSAIAVRALKAANLWLAEQRKLKRLCDDAVDELTEGAIQKRLAASPADFPLSDSWQK